MSPHPSGSPAHVYVFWSFVGFLALLLAGGIFDLLRVSKLKRADAQALLTARQLVTDHKQPAAFCGHLAKTFQTTTILGRIAREIMGAAWGGSHVSAGWGERIGREFEDRAVYARTIANLAVYIGLLGTLSGLAAVVLKLNSIPTIASPEDLKTFGNSIRDMFDSFGSSFVSAGAGILVTVILSVCLNIYDKGSTKLASEIESFAIQYILPASHKAQETGLPASNQEIARQLIDDLREVMREAHQNLGPVSSEMNETAAVLKEAANTSKRLTKAALDGGTLFVEASDKLQSASQALGNLSAEIGSKITTITEEVAKFQKFVAGWDPATLKEATGAIAASVPDMEVALGRIVAKIEAETTDALKKISESVSETKELVRQQTGLVGRYEEILSQLPSAIAAGGNQPAPAAPPPILDLSEVLDALRKIQGELAVQKSVSVPVSNPFRESSAPVIQPIPASVVSNLEAIASTLRRMESNLSANPQRPPRAVVVDPEPVPHPNGQKAKRKPWWRRRTRV